MKKLSKEEQLCIVGGINITATLIGNLVRGANIILDLGRSIGSAIRRIRTKRICSMY